MEFSIKNTTRKTTPRLPFEKVANKVLGKNYQLSLVFCGNSLSHKLNRTYRRKDKPANILSFELSPKSGEIFINLSKLEKFSILHLFIHGCLHLKGMQHGYTMDIAEKKLLYDTSNNSGY